MFLGNTIDSRGLTREMFSGVCSFENRRSIVVKRPKEKNTRKGFRAASIDKILKGLEQGHLAVRNGDAGV